MTDWMTRFARLQCLMKRNTRLSVWSKRHGRQLPVPLDGWGSRYGRRLVQWQKKQKQRKHNHPAKIYAVHLFGWTAFCFVNPAIQWRSEPILPAVWYSAAWFPAVWYSVGSCTAVQIAYNGNWRTKKAMQGCICNKYSGCFWYSRNNTKLNETRREYKKRWMKSGWGG